MARGVNKVIIVGNLGADPEIRYMPNGGGVVNISVATSESWKDRQTGEKQERTEWHRVVFYNRLADIAGEYLRKGSKVYLEGSLRTRKWQDQSGQDRYMTEIIANEMQMLDSRGAGVAAAPMGAPMGAPMAQSTPEYSASTPPAPAATSPSEPAAASEASTETAAEPEIAEEYDDHLPF